MIDWAAVLIELQTIRPPHASFSKRIDYMYEAVRSKHQHGVRFILALATEEAFSVWEPKFNTIQDNNLYAHIAEYMSTDQSPSAFHMLPYLSQRLMWWGSGPERYGVTTRDILQTLGSYPPVLTHIAQANVSSYIAVKHTNKRRRCAMCNEYPLPDKPVCRLCTNTLQQYTLFRNHDFVLTLGGNYTRFTETLHDNPFEISLPNFELQRDKAKVYYKYTPKGQQVLEFEEFQETLR